MRSTVQTKHKALHSPHHEALAARRQADIVTARTLCGVLRKRDALKGCAEFVIGQPNTTLHRNE